MRQCPTLLVVLFALIVPAAGHDADIARQRFTVFVPPKVEVAAEATELRIRGSVPIAIHDSALESSSSSIIHADSAEVITIPLLAPTVVPSQTRVLTILPL